MHIPTDLASQSKGLINQPSVQVHSKIVKIAGENYLRETTYIGREAGRVDYPFAAFQKAHRAESPWIIIALQMSAIATTSTAAGYFIGSLIT